MKNSVYFGFVLCFEEACCIACTNGDHSADTTGGGAPSIDNGGSHAGGSISNSKSEGGSTPQQSVGRGGAIATGGLTTAGGQSSGGTSEGPGTCGTGCEMPGGTTGIGGYAGTSNHAGTSNQAGTTNTIVILPNGGTTSSGVAGCGNYGGNAAGHCAMNPSGGVSGVINSAGQAGIAGRTSGGAGGATAGTGGRSGSIIDCSIYSSDLNCSSDSDCCVVADPCEISLWLVTRGQSLGMNACLHATSTSLCPPCLPPAVQVSCQNGKCVGEKLSNPGMDMSLRTPHCGRIGVAGASASAPKVAAPYDVTETSGTEAATGGTNSGTVRFGCG